MNKVIQKVVVVGGGTAGWMSAALIKRVLANQVDIELVESEEIGIIGVGEATIPPIQLVNKVLGIDECDFIKSTKATFKLAIQFEDWHHLGDKYLHTFGNAGIDKGFFSFHHLCSKAMKSGMSTNIWDYDLNALSCKQGKFAKIKGGNPMWDMPYAYHFDASLYGTYLKNITETWGIKHTKGLVNDVTLDPINGFVTSLLLKDGRKIEGDLFIDCTGDRGLLIQKALNTGFEDWSHWLACDRAVAIPSERFSETVPYTRSIAHSSGWQWRIPLQHRNGNGLVYSGRYCSDDEAVNTILNNLDSPAIGDPLFIRYRVGRARQQWNKNVVAIGLSSGFLEPLESTSIYLIQSAIVRLLKLFPHAGINTGLINEYNQQSKLEYETIRDFIILHYHLTKRNDSQFWRDMQQMAIPKSLSHKIELFKTNGYITPDNLDIFLESSWIQVMLGQGITPNDYHPLAAQFTDITLKEELLNMAKLKNEPLNSMPKHDDFLRMIGALNK